MTQYYITDDRAGGNHRILIHAPRGDVLAYVLYWDGDDDWEASARAQAARVVEALNGCGPRPPGRGRRRRAAVASGAEPAYHADHYEDDYESYWTIVSPTGEGIAHTIPCLCETGRRATAEANAALVVDALNAFHQGRGLAGRALRSWPCKR